MNKKVSRILQIALDNIIDLSVLHYDYKNERFIYRELFDFEEVDEDIISFYNLKIDVRFLSCRAKVEIDLTIMGDNDNELFLNGKILGNETNGHDFENDILYENNVISFTEDENFEEVCNEVLQIIKGFNEKVEK